MYGGQVYGNYDAAPAAQYDAGPSNVQPYNQNYGQQVQQNVNMFSPAMMEEPPTPTGAGRGARQTRSSRGGRGGSGWSICRVIL